MSLFKKQNIAKFDFPKKVIVTDQEIDISGLSDRQKDFHLELANEIVDSYLTIKQPRMIAGIAGPSGSGKSVSSAIVKEIFDKMKPPFRFEQIGLDGFTYTNSYLRSRSTHDGRQLSEVKGRYDTFDAEKLLKRLTIFKAGSPVGFPVYSRTVHDPVEDVIHISESEAVLLVEGLWLLHEGEVWEKIKGLFDFTLFFNADKDTCRKNVIKRHERGGRSHADAVLRWEQNDSPNYDAVMKEKDRADRVLDTWKWSWE